MDIDEIKKGLGNLQSNTEDKTLNEIKYEMNLNKE